MVPIDIALRRIVFRSTAAETVSRPPSALPSIRQNHSQIPTAASCRVCKKENRRPQSSGFHWILRKDIYIFPQSPNGFELTIHVIQRKKIKQKSYLTSLGSFCSAKVRVLRGFKQFKFEWLYPYCETSVVRSWQKNKAL